MFREPFLHIEDRNTITEFALMWCLSSDASAQKHTRIHFPCVLCGTFYEGMKNRQQEASDFVATPCHDARRNVDFV